MIEKDTIKLLRECDSGIKMGVSAIADVLDHTKDRDMKVCLRRCKEEHEALKEEVQEMLDRYEDEGKDPNPIVKGMSWMKTNVKLGVDDSDRTVADLIIDGCNMGVKSLSRYLNQYEAADEKSKDIAKRLIKLEAKLSEELRQYL